MDKNTFFENAKWVQILTIFSRSSFPRATSKPATASSNSYPRLPTRTRDTQPEICDLRFTTISRALSFAFFLSLSPFSLFFSSFLSLLLLSFACLLFIFLPPFKFAPKRDRSFFNWANHVKLYHRPSAENERFK